MFTDVSGERVASIYYPEDDGRIFIRNVDERLSDHISEETFYAHLDVNLKFHSSYVP
jgi:hypothetical protein